MAVTANLAIRAYSGRVETTRQPNPAASLRLRRRNTTLHEIATAAVTLFEARGVRDTTVDDIAHAAGVSPRTFFRYFPTKEHAAFDDGGSGERVIETAIELIRDGAPPILALDQAWLQTIIDFGHDDDDTSRYLRLRRLIATEPTLLSLALRRESEHAHEVAALLATAPQAPLDSAEALAVAETVGMIVRTAFDAWVHTTETAHPATLEDCYRHARASLIRHAAVLHAAT